MSRGMYAYIFSSNCPGRSIGCAECSRRRFVRDRRGSGSWDQLCQTDRKCEHERHPQRLQSEASHVRECHRQVLGAIERWDDYLEYEQEDDRYREAHGHERDAEHVCVGIFGGKGRWQGHRWHCNLYEVGIDFYGPCLCSFNWGALASSGNESYLLGHQQQEVPTRLFASRGPKCIDRPRSLVFLARDRGLFVGYAWAAARWLVNASGPLTMRAASWPRRPGPRDVRVPGWDDIRSFGGRLAP